MVVALFAPPLEVQLEVEAWIRWVTPFCALVNYYCKGGHHHKMGAGNWDHHPGNLRFLTNFKNKDKEVMMMEEKLMEEKLHMASLRRQLQAPHS